MFTKAYHLSLSWAKWSHFTPSHPHSFRHILIFSFHLCLGLPSSSFFQVSPPKCCMHFPSPYIVTYPTYVTILDFTIWKTSGEQYKSWGSSSHNFVQSPTLSSFYDKKSSSVPQSSTCSVYVYPLMLRHQVSHPYKMTDKIIVLYILIFTLL